MAKKIIITAVIFFAAYNIMLHLVKPSWDPFLLNNSVNKDRTEEYLFNPDFGESIVVGTSLFGRIQTDKVYNLAFSGASSMTGLNIIDKSGKTPKLLIVETNYFEKPVKGDLAGDFLVPWRLGAKKIFPSFRKRNAPMSFALGLGRYIVTGKKKAGSNFSNKYNEVLKDTLVQRKITVYQTKMEQQRIEDAVKAMKVEIDKLKAKGTKIVLLEMPIDQILHDTPLNQQKRDYIKKWFPASEYSYLPQFDPEQVETGDGLHLLPRACKKFNVWLNKELAAMEN